MSVFDPMTHGNRPDHRPGQPTRLHLRNRDPLSCARLGCHRAPPTLWPGSRNLAEDDGVATRRRSLIGASSHGPKLTGNDRSSKVVARLIKTQ
jgi:hypothetical protein